MPFKCVLLALLLLCSVPSCEPQTFNKKAFLAELYQGFSPDVSGTFSEFYTKLWSNATEKEVWKSTAATIKVTTPPRAGKQSKTTDLPRAGFQTNTTDTPSADDQQPPVMPNKLSFAGVWKCFEKTMDCLINPDICDVDWFLREFRTYSCAG